MSPSASQVAKSREQIEAQVERIRQAEEACRVSATRNRLKSMRLALEWVLGHTVRAPASYAQALSSDTWGGR